VHSRALIGTEEQEANRDPTSLQCTIDPSIRITQVVNYAVRKGRMTTIPSANMILTEHHSARTKAEEIPRSTFQKHQHNNTRCKTDHSADALPFLLSHHQRKSFVCFHCSLHVHTVRLDRTSKDPPLLHPPPWNTSTSLPLRSVLTSTLNAGVLSAGANRRYAA
jgi:hypothetical protein